MGDTVNLASRLESNSEPKGILLAGSTYRLLSGQYALADPIVMNLKGKGPTTAYPLLGRKEAVAAELDRASAASDRASAVQPT